MVKALIKLTILFSLVALLPKSAMAAETTLGSLDQEVLQIAQQCRKKVVEQVSKMKYTGRLKDGQLFDTFYIPVPGSSPQRFHTQYDRLMDERVRPILDGCLRRNRKIEFAIVVDRNGYAPTHNSRYSKPLTGDLEYDARWHRGKRLYNDQTGKAAAANKKSYLIQNYARDTGEKMVDLSVPISIEGRHWGALRIGYQP